MLKKKIGAISLGCDKNRVDLEHTLSNLEEYGFCLVDDLDEANIILVNTCAFILPAKQEAIENILLAISKKKIACEKVIVMGCLTSKDLPELQNSLPEVDYFVQIKDNNKIFSIIEKMYDVEPSKTTYSNGRKLTDVKHYAYLKIADGCNNGCSFCAIPRIRGRYRSVDIKELIKEAKDLANKGVKELILVAQDTTRYGIDLYNEYKLVELLQELSKIKNIKWIRILYAYPELVDEKLLTEINSNPKICKYIDIPLQHIDNDILKSMNRRVDESQVLNLIELLKKYSNICVRSTFIVGYPAETNKQFAKLCEFIKTSKLNNVGFFPYYREESTKAYYLKKQKFNMTKMKRLKQIQNIQTKIADDLNKKRIGQVTNILIDGFNSIDGYFYGHDNQNAPVVDFQIFINNENLIIGEFYDIKIIDYIDRNFIGKLVDIKEEKL